MINVNVKRVREYALLPTKTKNSYNIYAYIKHSYIDKNGDHVYDNGISVIENGETVFIHTGICLDIPEGYFGAIYAPNNTIFNKHKLQIGNCVNIIDSQFHEELEIPIYNSSGSLYVVEHGECIGQLIIHKCEDFELNEVEEF